MGHLHLDFINWNLHVVYVWITLNAKEDGRVNHAYMCRLSRANIKCECDSLVGLDFEVSAFLKFVSVFVPAEWRAGIARCLALQVQLVPFHQRLAPHQPELRSRGWTERERKRGWEKGSGERKSKLALLKLTTEIQLIYPFNCVSVCVCVCVCVSLCLYVLMWAADENLLVRVQMLGSKPEVTGQSSYER